MISGNIAATISDHLPQFLFAPNFQIHLFKAKIFVKEIDLNFVHQNFIFNYLDKNNLMCSILTNKK